MGAPTLRILVKFFDPKWGLSDYIETVPTPSNRLSVFLQTEILDRLANYPGTRIEIVRVNGAESE